VFIKAIGSGSFQYNSDLQNIEPEFRPVVQGLNEAMEAIKKPIVFAAQRVQELADGKTVKEIKLDEYTGSYADLMKSLNQI